MKHMLHVRSKSFFDVLAMTRFKTLFPIMIIAIFASFFLFALVSLAVAVEHGHSPHVSGCGNRTYRLDRFWQRTEQRHL